MNNQEIPLIQYGTKAPGESIFHKVYSNENFTNFIDVMKCFLNESKELYNSSQSPITACIAVAGPVKNNSVSFTNRQDWSIDGNNIASVFGIQKVVLINDFVANGYGLLTLQENDDYIVLQQGSKDKNSPIACIGAGTGLGQCYLTPDHDGTYTCFPSEGGHCDFTPRNQLEVDLQNYLKVKFNQSYRISMERIVSGIGLANVCNVLLVSCF